MIFQGTKCTSSKYRFFCERQDEYDAANDKSKCAEANCCNLYDQGTCSGDYEMWKTNEACATPKFYQYGCAKWGSALGQIEQSTYAGDALSYIITFAVFIGIIAAFPISLALSFPLEVLRQSILVWLMMSLIGIFSPVILGSVYLSTYIRSLFFTIDGEGI